MQQFDSHLLSSLWKPNATSHKGENGKVLVIGGSQLFHASIFWSAQIASKLVDMVYFSSPANENNELIRKKLKSGFWDGIVVDWGDVEAYIQEADCILIGPGMVRNDGLSEQEGFLTFNQQRFAENAGDKGGSEMGSISDLSISGTHDDTRVIVTTLLVKYPEKRWVVDGGALQMVNPDLLNENMIITPHYKEWQRLTQNSNMNTEDKLGQISKFSRLHNNVTVLLKGKEDLVCQGEKCVVVQGGNAGMTKGGTGDVLAGLVAGLYAKNDSFLAASAGSYINKRAGDALYDLYSYAFNASDLIDMIPSVLRQYID